jgi:N utilization substance protein B
MSEAPRDEAGEPTGLRRAARLAAVQALYQIEFKDDDVESVILEFVTRRQGVTLDGDAVLGMDEAFFDDLVRGACRRQAEIDGLLVRALAEDWRLERVEAVLRAILRAAIYELLLRDDVPVKVIINEYVEVAHAYLAAEQRKFVNAALDAIAHIIRPNELGPDRHDRPAETG